MKEVYEKNKKSRFMYLFTCAITDILLSKYECGYENETKESVLNEVIGLRYFKKDEINHIFNNAIKLLEIKYKLKVSNLNPIEFVKV